MQRDCLKGAQTANRPRESSLHLLENLDAACQHGVTVQAMVQAPTAARRQRIDLTGMVGLHRWCSLAPYPICATFPSSILTRGATA